MCGCGGTGQVKFKRLKTGAELPKKMTSGAACFDAVLPETYKPIAPGEIRIVPLGFSVELPEGFEMQVRARSGLASKGLIVANGIGTVDEDFRAEVGVILMNLSQSIFPLNKGDRICQLAIREVPSFEFIVVDELSETERGEGGFGSTKGHESL